MFPSKHAWRIANACSNERGNTLKLTVYFDGQFWVGVVEETVNDELVAARYIFGAEPPDATVLAFVNDAIPGILNLPVASHGATMTTRGNPKRLARLAAAEMRITGISTKSQQAIQDGYTARQHEAHVVTRAQKAAEQAYKRAIKHEQAKARHRGR